MRTFDRYEIKLYTDSGNNMIQEANELKDAVIIAKALMKEKTGTRCIIRDMENGQRVVHTWRKDHDTGKWDKYSEKFSEVHRPGIRRSRV